MKIVLSAAIALVSFQISQGMNKDEIRLDGQKIIAFSRYQTDKTVCYKASLENNTTLSATLLATGGYYCSRSENIGGCVFDGNVPDGSEERIFFTGGYVFDGNVPDGSEERIFFTMAKLYEQWEKSKQ